MPRLRSVFLGLALFALASPASAQLFPRSQGPLIEDFGRTFPTEELDFPTPIGAPLQAVFDVALAPEDAGAVNPRIDTLARFLNMHAAAGVENADMQLAVVLHGSAAKAVLRDEAHQAQFGAPNANAPLLAALQEQGVRIVLCGQSASSRGLRRADFVDGVELALSAMTALVVLQSEGYKLIAF